MMEKRNVEPGTTKTASEEQDDLRSRLEDAVAKAQASAKKAQAAARKVQSVIQEALRRLATDSR